MKLQGKVAIVTGAGSGIGRSIATTLSKEGSIIVIAERIEEWGNSVGGEIREAGGEILMMKVDVTKSDEVNSVVKVVLEKYHKIDILVNNAGVAKIEKFIEGDEKSWNRIIDVNIKGVILFTRAVLGGMIKRSYGKIINIGSAAGLVGLDQQVVYGATKGAVIAFTKGLAIELAPYKININCVCPGVIDTPMTRLGTEKYPDYFRKIQNNIPWGVDGQPGDIAKTVLFFASDDSEYLTGQTVCVDGGYTRH